MIKNPKIITGRLITITQHCFPCLVWIKIYQVSLLNILQFPYLKNTGTVIIKHTNPCGVSIHKNHLKSYQLALACDPTSAFGSVVFCNYKINKNLALNLNKIFLEVIIGNSFES